MKLVYGPIPNIFATILRDIANKMVPVPVQRTFRGASSLRGVP